MRGTALERGRPLRRHADPGHRGRRRRARPPHRPRGARRRRRAPLRPPPRARRARGSSSRRAGAPRRRRRPRRRASSRSRSRWPATCATSLAAQEQDTVGAALPAARRAAASTTSRWSRSTTRRSRDLRRAVAVPALAARARDRPAARRRRARDRLRRPVHGADASRARTWRCTMPSARAGHRARDDRDRRARRHDDPRRRREPARGRARSPAAANLTTEPGGVVQRFRLSEGGLRDRRRGRRPARRRTALAAARFPAEGAWIDFRGPPGTIPAVSFSDLLRGRADLAAAARPRRRRRRDRADAAGRASHADRRRNELMSGAEVQANAIWTALHGLPLRSAPGWVGWLAIVVIGLAPALAALRGRAVRARARGAAARRSAGSSRCRRPSSAGSILPVSYPLLALLLGTVSAMTSAFVPERERAAPDRAVLRRSSRREVAAARRSCARRSSRSCSRLGRAVESRDADTGVHVDRMSALSHRLALAVGHAARPRPSCSATPPCCTTSARSASPTGVLRKPGRFDADERALMETPHDDRRGDPRRLALAADPARRGDRALAPRALGRHRLSRRPGRRGDPARRAHLRGLRRLRRAHARRGRTSRAWPLEDDARRARRAARPPVRPRARRRVPRAGAGAASRSWSPPPPRRARRRRSGSSAAPAAAPPPRSPPAAGCEPAVAAGTSSSRRAAPSSPARG